MIFTVICALVNTQEVSDQLTNLHFIFCNIHGLHCYHRGTEPEWVCDWNVDIFTSRKRSVPSRGWSSAVDLGKGRCPSYLSILSNVSHKCRCCCSTLPNILIIATKFWKAAYYLIILMFTIHRKLILWNVAVNWSSRVLSNGWGKIRIFLNWF